jgi:hypothetical protein
MRKPRKLSHAESEDTRLKVLWRDQFPEAERDYWREQFASARSRGQLRQELGEKHGLKLSASVSTCVAIPSFGSVVKTPI